MLNLHSMKPLYNIYRYLVISRLAERRLRRAIANSIEDIVNVAFSFKYRDPIASSIIRREVAIDIKPMQIYDEIFGLARIVASLKPRTILEIGTSKGGTLFIWCRLASDDATIISVDLPGGEFGGGYPRWRIPLFNSFIKREQKLHLIRKDSHKLSTLKMVKEILGEKKLDFLFIDGDHTYEGVKKDFEMYSPLVRKEGIIAFHDIVPHDKDHDPKRIVGVPEFWSWIKRHYRYIEIVKDRYQGWAGIGVLYV